MKIGYGAATITPPVGTKLEGFFPARVSTGIEKDLYAKAIVLIDDEKVYSWFIVDMLGVDHFIVDDVKKIIGQTGIVLTDIQALATHTHSGPASIFRRNFDEEDGYYDKELYQMIVEKISDAIITGYKTARNFKYHMYHGNLEGFQTNRHHPDEAADTSYLAIKIEQDNGQRGLIYSFGGHPTILNSSSTLISPDYVGVVSELMDNYYDFNIFFNAPCGDMSTRLTRKESSLNELNRLGQLAGAQIIDAGNDVMADRMLTSYQVIKEHLKLKVRQLDSLENALLTFEKYQNDFNEAKARGILGTDLRVIESRLDGAKLNLEMSKQKRTITEITLPIDIVKVDGLYIVNLPGEVFSSLIKPLKELGNVWVNSLANEYCSYIVAEHSYQRNDYEAILSIFEEGEAERLIEYVKEVINRDREVK